MSEDPLATKSRKSLDRDLKSIREQLVSLGDEVEETLARAMQALETRNEKLSQEIIEHDLKLNDLRYEIEHACLSSIATQQPAAGDLREVIAVLSIVGDLERMGDHAAGIAKTVLRMKESPEQTVPDGLRKMADIDRDMLRQSMQAFVDRDGDLAYKVALQDDKIDSQYQSLFRDLMEKMGEEPTSSDVMLYFMFAGHNLERIADRVTNIAERVIFMVSGRLTELNPEPYDASLG
jgi:phosphate transport system protein